MTDHPVAKIKVYILYSPKDFTLKDELEKHLATLRNAGLIDITSDQITTGDVLEQQSALLENAHIVLPLISANFFGDEAFYQSMEAPLQRAVAREEKGETTVIPIILRDYLWQADTLLSRLRPLPESGYSVISRYWDSQDLAFFNIATGLQKKADALLKKYQALEAKVAQMEAAPQTNLAPPPPPNVAPPSAFDPSEQDGLAQQLIANAFYALFTRDLESGWLQLFPFLHASIRQNPQQLTQFRANNYHPAFERIRLYKQPVELIGKKNTGRNSLGILANKENGTEIMYTIAKKQDLGGMPSFIRVFFPNDPLSSPKISGLNL